MTRVAPHLVRPLPLLLAVEREHARRSAKLVAALALYGGIAASQSRAAAARPAGRRSSSSRRSTRQRRAVRRRSGGADPRRAPDARHRPRRGGRGGRDAELRAARRVRARARRDRRRGSARRPRRPRARRRLPRRDQRNRAVGRPHPRARPPGAPPLARLSKGVHAVLPLDSRGPRRRLFDESRTALAVPWQGMLLVGATDTEHDGDPDATAPTPADIAAVLEPLARIVGLEPARVVHSFAGLRVLPRGPGDTARASREHLVQTAPSGLVSIAGGKLTTHGTIALDVLAPAGRAAAAPRRPSDTPLPAPAALAAGNRPEPRRPPDGLYGSDAARVVAYARSFPDALERIPRSGPDVLAQALYARDEENALTVDDIVHRRRPSPCAASPTSTSRADRIAAGRGAGARGRVVRRAPARDRRRLGAVRGRRASSWW